MSELVENSTPSIPPTLKATPSQGDATMILYRILQQLIDIIGVLQSVAISQAEQLQFLSRWQKACTELLNEVPVFTQNSSIFGGTKEDASLLRDDMNRLNATFSEQIRAERSQHSDDSKALQANLNSTNDAITQMGNLLSAMIQQMSTIASAITR